MDEREFEDRLKARLHARFDRAAPSERLRSRVTDRLRVEEPADQRSLLIGAALAVAAVVAVSFVLGLSGILGQFTRPGATPPAVSPAAATPAPGVSSSPVVGPTPPGSVPPTTTDLWRGISITPLAPGPTSISSITAWAGGYLALPNIVDFG